MKLSDFKIIISGGAQGMGRHFAERLAEAGAEATAQVASRADSAVDIS